MPHPSTGKESGIWCALEHTSAWKPGVDSKLVATIIRKGHCFGMPHVCASVQWMKSNDVICVTHFLERKWLTLKRAMNVNRRQEWIASQWLLCWNGCAWFNIPLNSTARCQEILWGITWLKWSFIHEPWHRRRSHEVVDSPDGKEVARTHSLLVPS